MNREQFEKAKAIALPLAYSKAILNLLFDLFVISLAAAYIDNAVIGFVLFLVLLWRILKAVKKDYKGGIVSRAYKEEKKLFEAKQ